MSTEHPADGSVSRHSNGSNPPQADRGAETADFDLSELPTPAERVQEAVRKYPKRLFEPVSVSHGRKLRVEALEEPETVRREYDVGEGETEVEEVTVSRSALSWAAVLEEFLEMYERYRNMWLRLEKGRRDSESFEIPLDTSWSREANDRQYARFQALERETCGGERPSGEFASGKFDIPAQAMLTFSSSSTDGKGEFRSPVDHDRELVESWGGSDGIKRSLEYVLEDKLGLDKSAYVWRKQAEPHTSKRAGEGYGKAAGYSHHHVLLLFDAAEVGPQLPTDGEGRPMTEVLVGEFRRPIEKHVEGCELAGEQAHDLDVGNWVANADDVKTVQVGYVGDDGVRSPGSYMSKYVAVDTEDDLLERPVEFLMWGAIQWATSTQKFTQSNRASAAITADACKQRYEDEDAQQHRNHGEKVVRSKRPGVEFECACCGSPWGISQDHETVSEVVLENRDSGDSEASEGRSLAERWPGVPEAASVGSETVERECSHSHGANECPLCAESVGAVDAATPIPDGAEAPDRPIERESVERPDRWRPVAIRRGEEEYLIGSPGGSVYGEIVVEGADAIPEEKLIPPDMLRTPEPDVDPTEYPPPELIEKQIAEMTHDRPITPKQWPEDWHERRYEKWVGSDGPTVDEDRLRRFFESHPDVTVVEAMGRLELPSEAREAVSRVRTATT